MVSIVAHVMGWFAAFTSVVFVARAVSWRRHEGSERPSPAELLQAGLIASAAMPLVVALFSLLAYVVALLPFFWFLLAVALICFLCALDASRHPRQTHFVWLLASNWCAVFAFSLRYANLGVLSLDGSVTTEPADAFLFSCRTWFHANGSSLKAMEGPLLMEMTAQAAFSIPVLGFWVIHTARAMRPRESVVKARGDDDAG